MKLRYSGGGLLQEVGCLQGACLARNPQVLRQAPQEISGSAHRPPAATFAFRQAGSVAASRVMPPFPRPPRFAEGIFRRWRIRKGRAKRHISPRATVSRFFVASVEYARGMLHKVGFIFTCGDCGSSRRRCWWFPSENFTRAAGATHTCSARLTRSPFEVARMRGGKGRCI